MQGRAWLQQTRNRGGDGLCASIENRNALESKQTFYKLRETFSLLTFLRPEAKVGYQRLNNEVRTP